MKNKNFFIPSLDGIRAASFMMVFAAHSWFAPQLGPFGVSVFFFLSGYLITTLLRLENDEHGSISLRNFYVRRVLRILPSFYLTIAVILALIATHLVSGQITLRPVVAAALFVGNYWAIFHGFLGLPGFTPFWSLAVEEHFYLVFPLAFVLMCKARYSYKKQAVILAGVCALILVWRLTLVLGMGVTDDNRIFFGTDTRVDMILFGCILALGMNPVLDEDAQPSRWLSLCALALLSAAVIFRGPVMHSAVKFSLQGMAFIPLFTVAIKTRKWYTSWLNWKWVRFVGTLSYTLYLIHLAMLDTVRGYVHSTRIGAAVITLALSFLYAYVMNRAVEQPIARLRKRFRNTIEPSHALSGKASILSLRPRSHQVVSGEIAK